LLQASVDIATLALWLGHESTETTHVYLETDLALKEKALAKLDPVNTGWVRFKADDPLLDFDDLVYRLNSNFSISPGNRYSMGS
jgi:integrase/recombinase XerD